MLVLAFNSCGPSFFYWVKIQLCKIKAEVAEATEDCSPKSLVVFSSADKNVRFENSRELRVSGKMYDIVKTEIRNGVKIYCTTHDSDEDVFVAKLARSEKKAGHQTPAPVKAEKLYDAVFFAGNDDSLFNSFPSVQISNDAAPNDPHFFPLHFNEIFSPPPNGLFS